MTDTPVATFTPDEESLAVALHELPSAIRGEIVTPADTGWNEARQPWDLVDQRPALVAIPADAEDVQAIMSFARRHGLRVAPQATGHNAGPLGPLGDTILVSTRHLRGIEIDTTRRTARVQAGVIWLEVAEATSPYGLFPLSGSSPNVGVVGFTLGGGLSWLGRKHGLAANSVTAIEVVTSDGRFRRATPTDHADLFWALRGGGGNFGIVTALEFDLFPYGEVYAGAFVWPYDRRLDVIKGWHEWTRTATEDITTSLRIMHFPPADELPPFLSGRSVVMIDGAFAGDTEAGRAAVVDLHTLAPEVDTWGMLSPAELVRLHMDPEQPVATVTTSALLNDLDAAGYRAFAAAAQPPLTVGEIRHLGGALSRVPVGAGSLGSFRGEYLTMGAGMRTELNRSELDAAVQRFRVAMSPYENGYLYYNFSEASVDTRRFYPDDVYERLRRIRARVDPEGLVVANHSIPTTT
jgi:FAD/FMN-containing dehydrogenase